MPEEEQSLDWNTLSLIRAVGRQVELEVIGVGIYKQGRKMTLALQIRSPMIMWIRANLGIRVKPNKLNLHISLFEKYV